jgi:tetratricopeptide (TPR) repeat protein
MTGAFAAWIACGVSTVCLLAQTDALLDQADSAFRDGDIARSTSLARRALAEDPNAVHAHMILGIIAAQNKEWTVSNKHLAAVVRLEPSNPYGYFYLGQAKLYQQQWAVAITHFSNALKRGYPDKARLMIELAMAQQELGRPHEALANLAAVDPPADTGLAAQYYGVLAFSRGKAGQASAAIEAIQQALQRDDSNAHYWDFLITTLIKIDEAPHALAEAIRAQRKFPDDPDIQYAFALASYHVTESPLSKLALRNLREADANDPRVLFAEGLLARKLGKTEEATDAFRRASARGVQDAHLLIGIVYKESGDYETAEREYREAAKLNPNNGQVMLELGKLLLARGQLQEARTWLEKANQFMPEATTVHYQLGHLYRRLGDAEKSQYHFGRVKEQDPTTR